MSSETNREPPAPEQESIAIPSIAYAHAATPGAGITRGDVAALVVRVIGIYLMLQGIPFLLILFQFGMRAIGNMFAGGLTFALIEALGMGLVLAAPSVGRWLLPRTPVSLEVSATPGSPVELQAAAFAFLGVYLVVTAVPAIASEIVRYLSTRTPVPEVFQYFFRRDVQSLAELALGIWLFFGSKQLSRFWDRLRRNEPRPRDESGPL